LLQFLDCLHQFDPKKTNMMLVPMLDLRFKNLFTLNHYVRIKKPKIVTRYGFETLIPLLCLVYAKIHTFVKHP
jgi:hypothetical protein